MLLLDRDLLTALLPDGDLDATLLVEVVGSALVVRREDAPAPTVDAVEQAATVAAPDVPGLSPTERLVLDALRPGSATRGELADVVQRAPETVSAALKTLKGQGLVASTGRDWRLTPTAKTRLEADESRKFAELPAALARLMLALEDGPATAAQLQERLGVTRGAVLTATRQGIAAGLVQVDEAAIPHYRLTAT